MYRDSNSLAHGKARKHGRAGRAAGATGRLRGLRCLGVLAAFVVTLQLCHLAARTECGDLPTDEEAAFGRVDFVGAPPTQPHAATAARRGEAVRRLRPRARESRRGQHRRARAGLVQKPSCVTQLSVRELLRRQRPRRIYIITPEQELCATHLASLAREVTCIHEDFLLPGVNKKAISDGLLRRFPELQANTFQKGRTPAGWYLQQVRPPHTPRPSDALRGRSQRCPLARMCARLLPLAAAPRALQPSARVRGR